jgi:hypothetical protein
MWNETVKANCILARSSASKPNIVAPYDYWPSLSSE